MSHVHLFHCLKILMIGLLIMCLDRLMHVACRSFHKIRTSKIASNGRVKGIFNAIIPKSCWVILKLQSFLICGGFNCASMVINLQKWLVGSSIHIGKEAISLMYLWKHPPLHEFKNPLQLAFTYFGEHAH